MHKPTTYQVKLYKPEDSRARTFVCVATYRCGTSLEAAYRTAHDLMRPHAVEGTRHTYRRELARAPYADIRSGAGQRIACVEPDVRLVPSVGELGVTP